MQSPGAPLEINTVTVGDGGGVVGMCCCPGRIEQHNDGVHRPRELSEDLAMVSEWQPDLVISLIELHEFDFLGVAQLPEELKEDFSGSIILSGISQRPLRRRKRVPYWVSGLV